MTLRTLDLFARRSLAVLTLLCVAGSVTSSLRNHPHSLAYFNEVAGGPENGWRHMLGSNLDWGQDLLFLKEWLGSHAITTPVEYKSYRRYHASYASFCTPHPVPRVSRPSDDDTSHLSSDQIFVISATRLAQERSTLSHVTFSRRFAKTRSVSRIGYSLFVFRYDEDYW